MPQEVINGVGKLAVRNPAAISWDADAVAFTTAAAITNDTQKTAVNDLVVDLKTAGIWSKMNALYPMIGGTAISHKWNLKDPRDLDAAYRLNFQGGWTHSSTGATPNGTNGYANTFLSTGNIGLNSVHLSYYSLTNNSISGQEMGALQNLPNSYTDLGLNYPGYGALVRINNGGLPTGVVNSDSRGFYVGNRTSSSILKLFKNGSVIRSGTDASNATTTRPIYIGGLNNQGTAQYYTNRQCAFASIGSGLTDLESSLFYQIVEKFQATLGRNVNASRSFYFSKNYSNEVNAFIFNGGITDATQMSATNTLVNTLKTAGIWSKMKAVYPMVGGTATSHKFNLVNPIDSTSAYALTFNGGWTHSSTGALPNGSNSYADTSLIPSTTLTAGNFHFAYYSRTQQIAQTYEMGALNLGTSTQQTLTFYENATVKKSVIHGQYPTHWANSNDTNTLGLLIGSRTASNNLRLHFNGSLIATNSGTFTNHVNLKVYLGAVNYSGGNLPSAKQCSFSSIGDGLTDAEALTFYNAVQAFQTTLGRQV